jgi:hypothetical protein
LCGRSTHNQVSCEKYCRDAINHSLSPTKDVFLKIQKAERSPMTTVPPAFDRRLVGEAFRSRGRRGNLAGNISWNCAVRFLNVPLFAF